jgi:hypothetical protein
MPGKLMADTELYRSQDVDDLGDYGDGKVVLDYYDRIPHRLTFTEPVNADGLYHSVVVTYTEDDASPFLIRALSLYGEVHLASYEYTQFEGFTRIVVPASYVAEAPFILVDAIPAMGKYLHDLLMFHRIDPPSCSYVPSSSK